MGFLILPLQLKLLCFYSDCFVVDTSVTFEGKKRGRVRINNKKKKKAPKAYWNLPRLIVSCGKVLAPRPRAADRSK